MGSLCGKEKVVVKSGTIDQGAKPKVLRFKVCIVGTYDAGKSSIVVRLMVPHRLPSKCGSINHLIQQGSFIEGEVITDGRPQVKRINVDGQEVDLELHDTAGQEHYQNVTAGFYDAADALVFVYSIASTESFNDLPDWLKEAREASVRGRSNPLRLLLGNKYDLAQQRKITIAEAEKFAKNSEMQYFEVSAKTGDGIDRAFQTLASLLVEQHRGTHGMI